MGIKGLFQFLKRFEKDVPVSEFCLGRSIGIDIFWFIHKSKGDLFALKNMLLPVINTSAEIHCVFDGHIPSQKKSVLNALHRKDLLDTIERIESFMRQPFTILPSEKRNTIYLYIKELKKQAWLPTPQYIQSVRQWLIIKGCIIYQAEYEADNILIELEKSAIISAVLTNDSDLLALGGQVVIRLKNPTNISLYDVTLICKDLAFTTTQWKDFMYLCLYMKENDILLAYSLISVYKDLEYVLQKSFSLYSDYIIRDIVV